MWYKWWYLATTDFQLRIWLTCRYKNGTPMVHIDIIHNILANTSIFIPSYTVHALGNSAWYVECWPLKFHPHDEIPWSEGFLQWQGQCLSGSTDIYAQKLIISRDTLFWKHLLEVHVRNNEICNHHLLYVTKIFTQQSYSYNTSDIFLYPILLLGSSSLLHHLEFIS